MNVKTSILLLTSLATLLPACSSVKVWPFGDSGSSSGQARTPANSTEYQCSNNKHFYVRLLDGGNTAWLIYPDREVGLNKSASGNRYTNGVAVLELNGNDSTLTDGAQISYSGCKPATLAK